MDPKYKKSLIVFLLISISILTGAVIAPSFLNWGIERSLPVYDYSTMDTPLMYNQYLIKGDFLTSNEKYVYVGLNSTWIQIETSTHAGEQNYKLCAHESGEPVKYAVFINDYLDWDRFVLRRELC